MGSAPTRARVTKGATPYLLNSFPSSPGRAWSRSMEIGELDGAIGSLAAHGVRKPMLMELCLAVTHDPCRPIERLWGGLRYDDACESSQLDEMLPLSSVSIGAVGGKSS